mgnify:CR=1 FL=1
MGKRPQWIAITGLLAASVTPPLLAAPPASLPADQLDWQAWGSDRPAGALCRGRYVMPDYRLPATIGDQVTSESDSGTYGRDGETILQGEVVLRRGDTQVEAPQLRLPPARDRVIAEQGLTLRDRNLLVRGERGEFSLESQAASIDVAHYVGHEQQMRGDAQRLARLDEQRYRLREASFTTCEPDSDLWRLIGKDILLDRESGVGTARHARLEVGKVPVFYWPWVRFPIDDRRQSGFLWPTIGISGNSFDYAQPYYWNIAPDQDATLIPRWFSGRGLMLGGEYRYLLPSSSGIVEGAYLDDDERAGAEASSRSEIEDGDKRWYVDYRHRGRIDPRTDYQLRYGAASDGNYFKDFGRSFGESDTQVLPRLARITHQGDVWRLDAAAQGYQRVEDPLNPIDKPFYRLPSLNASAGWRQEGGFYQNWNSNLTYFWRDDIGDDQGFYTFDARRRRVPVREAADGLRLRLAPNAGWRHENSWSFFEPKLALINTTYELDYGKRETDYDESLSQTVPVSSLDMGLIFEREIELLGDGYRQTLEPRLNYAYVPARDQSEFPNFDTSELAFSWHQLWSPYRFSGGDRVGDLNRLSWGLDSRLLEDDSGRRRVSLGVGQALYLEDRHIDMDGDTETLPRDPDRRYQNTRKRSPLVTRLDWQINDQWRSYWEWLYDDQRNLTEQASLGVEYRANAGHVFNVGYRWEVEGYNPFADADDRLGYDREELDLSFAIRALPQLDLIGRVLYDNTNDRALEQLAGVQWNDCCHGVQLVWREWIDDDNTAYTIDDDTTDRGIFLRFVFKGLGGVGGQADTHFRRAIPGYRSTALDHP